MSVYICGIFMASSVINKTFFEAMHLKIKELDPILLCFLFESMKKNELYSKLKVSCGVFGGVLGVSWGVRG